MIRIGVISDTHGYIDSGILDFFKECNEVWHAGDIGDVSVIESLEKHCSVKAVYGNIDGYPIRSMYTKHLRFMCEGVDVWLTHIGGYPKRYDAQVKQEIYNNPPKLFICGHSHILKVMNDESLGLLHINPGAAGKSGLHVVRTAVRFTIDGENIKDLEVYQIPRS